jgi:mannose/cellobiose epimerase-like protein (N-acyl-D-glucosamine 2-epimerase family)
LASNQFLALTNPVLAEEAKDALRRHVIEPLLERCADEEYGGFLVDFDERWRPAGPHNKTLEHASRTTLSFALIERAMPGLGCARLVRHGCEFLRSAFWDVAHSGFFAQVERSGGPCWEGLKHPHAVTYVAQAFLLAEPVLPTGEGRLWASRAQQWLDDVAWDPEHGGYWGSYRRNNEPYPEGARLPTPNGLDVLGLPVGFKESNTLSDAIETLTILAAHGLGGQYRDRLGWLVELVAGRLTEPSKMLPYVYHRDWQASSDAVHLGQQFQMIHRLVAAAGVLGEMRLLGRCCDLAESGLAFGRHPDGGFCFAFKTDGTGSSSNVRQWWVQLEAVRALHALAGNEIIDQEKRECYAMARDQQWAFVRGRFFDNRYGGLWEFAEDADVRSRKAWSKWLRPWLPASQPLPKAHGWKDPSHEVGAFLALAGLLGQ